MTERLYYTDSYLREFSARIVERSADGLVVALDRTAFYPTSGGQPHDFGSIGGVAIVEVTDEGDRVAHRLAGPAAEGEVDCRIDWERRFDHMQQHTGQHLLSAVFEELYSLKTVSFHLGGESSTIDLEGGGVDAAVLRAVERRANDLVFENRPVAIAFRDAAEAEGLRKASEREGTLRIISIEGLDHSACGGTHVRSTGEIGAILLRKTEKVRQSTRVEFLCGARAVRRARADYEALFKTAQVFSAQLDEVPTVAAAQSESVRVHEKARRKLELELAGFHGRELYQSTPADHEGFRRVTRRLDRGDMEELRAVAQHFTAQPKAVFVATLAEPPSILVAASSDSGLNAGKALKSALTAAGGRGGGTDRIAQGSVPAASLLEQVLAAL